MHNDSFILPINLPSDLYDNTGAGEGGKLFVLIDKKCRIFHCNDNFQRIFKQKTGDNFALNQADSDVMAVIQRMKEFGMDNFSFEVSFSLPESIENFNAEIQKAKLFDDYYYIIILHPMQEESLIEERINNLHYALEYGDIPVIITNEHGRIIFSTGSFEKILDFELDVIYNNHISTALSLFLTPGEVNEIEKAIIDPSEWVGTIKVKDEKEKESFYELKLTPIYKEESGSWNFILSAHDISYHIYKSIVARRSEERLKSIINNISDLLVILKEKNGVMFFDNANDNFCETFDIVKSKVLHSEYDYVLDQSFVNKIKLTIDSLHKGNLAVKEFNYTDSHHRYYEGKISFIDDPNEEETIYVISLQDVTERRIHEEQLKVAYNKEMQLNRLKTTFLQNMSHEIRTPVTAVMGYSEIMNECLAEGDFDTISELTKSLKNVLNRVVNLFNNILEVAQLESGEIEIEMVALNCNKVLRSIYERRREEAKQKGLNFVLEEGEFEDLVEIDWVKFERIVLNLVDNALKYTSKGEIKIKSEKIGGIVKITVADTGTGIKSSAVSRLLEPFVQEEEDGHARNYEGAGLGLTIAYDKKVQEMESDSDIERRRTSNKP